MLDLQDLIIENFVTELKEEYAKTYHEAKNDEHGELIAWTGRLALENIANCDMLYHNVEHTIMVTMAGQQILRGRHISEGNVTAEDWLHFLVALVCHDIGYAREACRADTETHFATGIGDEMVEFEQGGTCASLTPYHVDRGKLFIHERFDGHDWIDPEVVASYIEMTRFPVPDDAEHRKTDTYGGLVRAADLIGQLGDPNYLRKLPALYYEFEELGTNEKIGYTCPGDMRTNYAKFFWGGIHEYIKDGVKYLRITQEGHKWIANLSAHVFSIEHGF